MLRAKIAQPNLVTGGVEIVSLRILNVLRTFQSLHTQNRRSDFDSVLLILHVIESTAHVFSGSGVLFLDTQSRRQYDTPSLSQKGIFKVKN